MEKIDKLGELLKVLGHPVRLKILFGLLDQAECNVNKMTENLGIPQSTASQHLAALKAHGLISFRKEGTKVCYRIAGQEMADFVSVLRKMGNS